MSKVQFSSVIPASEKDLFTLLCDLKYLSFWKRAGIELEPVEAEAKLAAGGAQKVKYKRLGLESIWTLTVETFDPPHGLAYSAQAPYVDTWVHSLKLVPHDKDNTLLVDRVDFSLTGGIVGKFFDDLIVRNDVVQLIEAGHENIRRHFEG